jgi:hypothetical protein
MDDNVISWTVILNRCPYCGHDLNISSLSTRSLKDSISNILIISRIHLDKCREGRPKKLTDITIKEKNKIENRETITFRKDKILT